jgi:hypothetical protein
MLFALTCAPPAQAYTYCPQGQFYDPKSLSCAGCQSSQESRLPFSLCRCALGSYQNGSHFGYSTGYACLAAGLASNQVFLLADSTGAAIAAPAPLTCAATAYPNEPATACLPCPSGMTFSTAARACRCPAQQFQDFCFTTALAYPAIPSTDFYTTFFLNIAGACREQASRAACESVKSLCATALYRETDPFCIQFNTVSNTVNFTKSAVSVAL